MTGAVMWPHHLGYSARPGHTSVCHMLGPKANTILLDENDLKQKVEGLDDLRFKSATYIGGKDQSLLSSLFPSP